MPAANKDRALSIIEVAASIQEFRYTGRRSGAGYSGLRPMDMNQALLQLGLCPNLRQNLFNKAPCERQPRVAHFLVAAWADELFNLGVDRLLEALRIAPRVHQNQFRTHEPNKVKKRGERFASDLSEGWFDGLSRHRKSP
jgi:hypothetical protein